MEGATTTQGRGEGGLVLSLPSLGWGVGPSFCWVKVGPSCWVGPFPLLGLGLALPSLGVRVGPSFLLLELLLRVGAGPSRV